MRVSLTATPLPLASLARTPTPSARLSSPMSPSASTTRQSSVPSSTVAERGVVFFREQDDLGLEEAVKLGSYWGPLHVHPLVPHTTANPEVIVLDSRLSPPNRYNTNNS
ncbi:hypothetical protein BGZ94_006779, partial [Podila epigama]